jgi:hypothetical protein
MNESPSFHPLLLAVMATLGLATTASGQTPVTITNPGFETDVLADGATVLTQTLSNWNGGYTSASDVPAYTVWVPFAGEGGATNPAPGGNYSGVVPEGNNAGFAITFPAFRQGIRQILAETIVANASYDLSVKVGNPNVTNSGGAGPDYVIQMVANGTVVASAVGASPASGTFVTVPLNYVAPAPGDPLVGQPVEIRMLVADDGSTAARLDFDDVTLTRTLVNPVANPGGPYVVGIGGSLSLNGAASQPSDGQAITLYEWDLDDDGIYDITGATPTAINDADLQTTYGMEYGDNTIVLRVTDDSSPTPKTATANATVKLSPPIAGQLGILDLTANGGINPNTNAPWQVGDKYRIAFYTAGKSEADITDPTFYNDFVTTQAKLNSPLAGTSWRALMSTAATNARANTGTSNLTGGSGVGGAGEPVYVVNGSTCIARNNADIWDTWSNPFAGNAVIRLALGSTNNNSAGAPVVASQNVHYSPYIDQFGLGDSATVHGVEVWTGSNSNGTALSGQEVGHVPNTNWGSSNANNTTRVWNRGNANSGPRSFYAISIPLTVVDLAETVLPTLTSFVDSQEGADYFVGAPPIVYTVTFSEVIDASTLTPADFGNAGTAGITVDKIRGTLDGAVFEVTVTPTSAGTVQLQVNELAVIEDPVGNALDSSSAILDDTTITVINDTTPPTLTSIVDDVGGGPIVATKFSTPTYTVTFDELIQPASLTVDDFENGSTAPVTIDSVSSTADPAVFLVTVTTSAPGDLVLQIKQDAVILDVAGNELDTTSALADDTTITVNPVPEIAGQLGVLDIVNANGGLNPATGLAWAPGDTYRLIFLTSQTTNAISTDIATYNTFVQGVAAASSAYPSLGSGTWKILASTETVDARDNTGTNPGSGTGVGIFLTNGRTMIASNNADLWDGFLASTVSLNENASPLVENRVFTGSNFNGTSVGIAGGDKPLGVLDGDGVRTGQSDSLQFWFVQWKENGNNANSVYAISNPLTVISTASGSPYDTWAGGPFLGTLVDPDPALDFDTGGLATSLEWVLGGDPTDGSDDATIAPTFDNTTDPDFFIFTYRRADAAEADANTAIKMEYGSDLGGWTEAVAGADIIVTPDEDGAAAGIDLVEVKIRRTLAVDGQLFARLNVRVATP